MDKTRAISEAIELITLSARDDITKALSVAFGSPAPAVSAEDFRSITAAWNSPEFQLWLDSMLMDAYPKEPLRMPRLKYTQHVKTYEDGTQAAFQILEADPPSIALRMKGPERLIVQARLEEHLPKGQVQKIAGTLSGEQLGRLLAAAEKIGVPEKGADLLAGKGDVQNALKAALTRHEVKTAVVNGVWQNALLTGVCSFGDVIDGNFKTYLVKIGVSGVYGGTIGGLSMWIEHPFFSNGAVLGVLLGSALDSFNLVSTGDWARFGKNLGLNLAGTGVAWGAGWVGSAVGGLVGGPLGAAIGGTLCGLGAGYVGRKWAVKIPGLGGMTDHEVEATYAIIKEQLRGAGMEPDPSLLPAEVVAKMFEKNGPDQGLPFPVKMTGTHAANVEELKDALQELWDKSPEAFMMFKGLLGAAQACTDGAGTGP